MKFNRYLHPNEHPQKIFWYFVRPFDQGLLKNSYFCFQCQFTRSKINYILLKFVFLLKYWIRRTSFINHCWLEHVRNSKKMAAQAEHIFDTFEYFWDDHKSKFFCNCLVTRWHHHRFCWKLEFWAEISLVNSFREKMTSR